MYRLGWVTSCSPLYASKLPDWKHHDALLTYLKRTKGNSLEIVCPIPQAGSIEMMDRVYDGDNTPLYHTLRGLGINFYNKLVEPKVLSDILDGLVCDGLALFQEVKPLGHTITPLEQYNNLHATISYMLAQKKPVIIVDNDKVCTRPFNPEEDNVLIKLYNSFKKFDTFYVFSPYDQVHTVFNPNNFKHVPFEVDPESLQPITPLKDRQYLLRYIGNNYYKSETHVPIFNRLSEFGPVYVSGKYWTEEDKKNSPKVKYGPAVSFSQDNMHSCYGNSVLGLSGASKMHDESLYHLRWKEMIIGGTYILRENDSKYMKEVMGESFNYPNLTVPYIAIQDEWSLKNFIIYIHQFYDTQIVFQREELMKFFNVERWAPVWEEVLRF